MRKNVIIIGALSIGILTCIWGIYFIEDSYLSVKNWLSAEAIGGNFIRGIGTNMDFWLNGYLGIFFRLNKFGWLNWLVIPLFIYFLATIRKRERWEIALALAVTLSCIFISMQGYKNYRYQSKCPGYDFSQYLTEYSRVLSYY